MQERFDVAPELRAGILIGLLSAFTTFSTSSLETIYLPEQGGALKALLNIALNLLLCLFAIWFGLLIGRQL